MFFTGKVHKLQDAKFERKAKHYAVVFSGPVFKVGIGNGHRRLQESTLYCPIILHITAHNDHVMDAQLHITSYALLLFLIRESACRVMCRRKKESATRRSNFLCYCVSFALFAAASSKSTHSTVKGNNLFIYLYIHSFIH